MDRLRSKLRDFTRGPAQGLLMCVLLSALVAGVAAASPFDRPAAENGHPQGRGVVDPGTDGDLDGETGGSGPAALASGGGSDGSGPQGHGLSGAHGQWGVPAGPPAGTPAGRPDDPGGQAGEHGPSPGGRPEDPGGDHGSQAGEHMPSAGGQADEHAPDGTGGAPDGAGGRRP